jgi:hypothetical protein
MLKPPPPDEMELLVEPLVTNARPGNDGRSQSDPLTGTGPQGNLTTAEEALLGHGLDRGPRDAARPQTVQDSISRGQRDSKPIAQHEGQDQERQERAENAESQT